MASRQGKGARSRNKAKRAAQKSAQKAAKKALYAERAARGNNSKRTRNHTKVHRPRARRHGVVPCGNPGCAYCYPGKNGNK